MTSVLPPAPDLDHLRREARRLLAQVRAGDPAARERWRVHAPGKPEQLTAAQFVVAREHGLASWTQLKALVASMASGGVRYDAIGRGYSAYRRPDPRISRALQTAIGDARTVVNVGAGTGSYEPRDRPVIPVEPSTTMALQRDPALAPAVLGSAESLPLADGTVDAAMAVLTLHHWADPARGLRELARVARRRVVLLTIDAEVAAEMWLLRDYAPEIAAADRRDFPSMGWIAEQLPGRTRVVAVPVPADCADGFLLSFWSRPEQVLDRAARAATSGFARLSDDREEAIVGRLRGDLDSGVWDRAYGHLRSCGELDAGLRLIVSEQS